MVNHAWGLLQGLRPAIAGLTISGLIGCESFFAPPCFFAFRVTLICQMSSSWEVGRLPSTWEKAKAEDTKEGRVRLTTMLGWFKGMSRLIAHCSPAVQHLVSTYGVRITEESMVFLCWTIMT